jgi:hypothetical protein
VGVVEVDHVDLQPLQGRLAGAEHKLRPAVGVLAAGTAEVAELGGQHHPGAPACQRLADQFLVMPLAVGGAGKRHAAEPDR